MAMPEVYGMSRWQRMLIAIDGEEASLKALRYVGEMTGNIKDLSICLLHVFPPPAPDYYSRGGSLDDYREFHRKRVEPIFAKADTVLHEYQVTKTIEHRIEMADGATISETMLKFIQEGDYGTVVVGKRGVSKAEEFLFGSISNALAQHCRDYCIWIVG